MGTEALAEYELLIKAISRRPHYRDSTLLEAEHGSMLSESAGSCILHTHVNVMPGLAHHATMFDGVLPLIGEYKDLTAVSDLRQPYIYLRGGTESARFYCGKNIPSQLIRKQICDKEKRADWDWAVFPKPEWVSETVRMWPDGETCEETA